MPLDFGDNAYQTPSAPGSSSSASSAAAAPVAPDKKPASTPVLVPSSGGPLAWLALALAVGWILLR